MVAVLMAVCWYCRWLSFSSNAARARENPTHMLLDPDVVENDARSIVTDAKCYGRVALSTNTRTSL